MKRLIRSLVIDQDGPTAVEYAVLLALIVVVCVGSVKLLANQTASSYESSAEQLSEAIG